MLIRSLVLGIVDWETDLKMSENEKLLSKEIDKLKKENATWIGEVRKSERVISNVFSILDLKDLLPPELLRMHVGTTTSAVNFYAQGAGSSRAAISFFGPDPGGAVLDWGCGSGRTLNWLRLIPAWRDAYHGCDVDPEAINWLTSQGVPRVKLCADDPPLDYEPNTFVGLFCFSVLTHIHPSRHKLWYDEIHRVLKPGGKALITTQGQTVVNSGRVADPNVLESFRSQGWAHKKNEGHYKDAALVSRDYSVDLMKSTFANVEVVERGYNNMEAYVAYK